MKLAALFEDLVGPGSGVRFEAYDGSTAGDPDATIGLTLCNENALRHLVSGRGSLGLARAFVGSHPGLH